MKTEKGITLIALIITIIVMLILVAVTINVALNGGIFNKATDAKNKTQKEADREELLSSIYATLDNRGNLQIEDELENYLPEGWDLEPSSNAKYLACTSAKNVIFYVNIETGKILETLPEAEPEESENPEVPEDPGTDPENPQLDPLSFTVGDLFAKASDKADVAGSVSVANFLELAQVNSLDDLEGYYNTEYSYMNVSTNNSLLIGIPNYTGSLTSGQHVLSFVYDVEDNEFSIIILGSGGQLDSGNATDKTEIDGVASSQATTVVTLLPLS